MIERLTLEKNRDHHVAVIMVGRMLGKGRLKWVSTTGLSFGLVRFALSAIDGKLRLSSGVLLHGGSFAFVFITAEIYIDQSVDPLGGGGHKH